jgi:hypothetical protein
VEVSLHQTSGSFNEEERGRGKNEECTHIID